MNFMAKEMKSLTVVVGPELARTMLATSPGNRQLRTWYVALLVAALKRGEWRLTHQSIAFDIYGRLRDGHHRLNAIAQAGMSVTLLVTLGCDPLSFDVVDQGIGRSLADVTGLERRVAEPLRLATSLARNSPRVTTQECMKVAEGGIVEALESLLATWGGARRFYSTAPMKVAAAISMMNGSDPNYVLTQYKALCTLDFERMSPASQALVRQVESSKATSVKQGDSIARGLRVFDEKRSQVTKIQVSEQDITAANELVRTTVLDSIGESRRSGMAAAQRKKQSQRTPVLL